MDVSTDGTTIEARLTIKKGNLGKDPTWNLRVGSDVVRDAFTVTTMTARIAAFTCAVLCLGARNRAAGPGPGVRHHDTSG